MSIEIERIESLPEGLAPLVDESEAEGFFPLGRLVEDWRSGRNRFDRPGEALFAATRDGRFVGVCGLNRDPYVDDPRVGRVRHLYVAVGARGGGVGGRLVQAVIEAARPHFERLRLRTDCPIAGRFYRSLGFTVTPDDRSATHAMELSG